MKRKWILLAIAVVLMGTGYLLLEPIIRVSRRTWPPITAPEILIAETRQLIATGTNGMVERAAWPPSIAALNPRYLSVRGTAATVTISTGGINPAWGFVVIPDRRAEFPTNQSARSFGVVTPGIFRFETIE